jgi:hypothetical protein
MHKVHDVKIWELHSCMQAGSASTPAPPQRLADPALARRLTAAASASDLLDIYMQQAGPASLDDAGSRFSEVCGFWPACRSSGHEVPGSDCATLQTLPCAGHQEEGQWLLAAALSRGNVALAQSLYRAMCGGGGPSGARSDSSPAEPAGAAAWPPASPDTVALMVSLHLLLARALSLACSCTGALPVPARQHIAHICEQPPLYR